MTVYMYAADWHCEECGEEIRKELAYHVVDKMREAGAKEIPSALSWFEELRDDLADMVIEHMEKQIADSDDWPISYDSAGEADCPQNCGTCSKPLEYSLTNVGIDYVVEHVREKLKSGRENYCKVHPSHNPETDYYVNSPAFRVVADWVEDMRYYHLEGKAARIFRMVEWMERVYEQERKKVSA